MGCGSMFYHAEYGTDRVVRRLLALSETRRWGARRGCCARGSRCVRAKVRRDIIKLDRCKLNLVDPVIRSPNLLG